MKKFLFLIAALLMGASSAVADNITSLEQVESDAYYTIHCGRGYLTVNTGLTTLAGSNSGTLDNPISTTFDAEDANFQFQFVQSEENYYLYNVGAQKYVNAGAKGGKGTLVAEITEATPILFRAWADGTVQPYWDADHNLNLGGSKQVIIDTWSQKDAGDEFEITKLEIADFTIVIEGYDEGAAVIKGTNYTDGQTVTLATANAAAATGLAVEGYKVSVSINGQNIVVTYTWVGIPVLGAEDINPNKAYYIYTEARGGFTIKTTDDTRLWGTHQEGVGQEVDPTDVRQQFAFISYKGGLYLYSVGAQKFVSVDGVGGKLTEKPINTISFANPGNGTVRLLFNEPNNNFNLGGSKQMDICYWSAKDAGNSFIILECADFDPQTVINALPTTTTYTYNYVINGETYKTIEVDLEEGQEPGENIADLDFVNRTDYSIDGTTVTVYCEEALPFTVTIDETSPVVGLLRIHSNQNRYAYVDAEGKGCNTGAGNKVNDFNDSYRWYITGSLVEGFRLHNLAAEGALEATATQATMTAEGSVWQLAATEGTGSKYKGFALTADGTNYLNAQGGLNYWTAADAGSAMSFDEIVEDAEVTITEAGIATYYYGDDETRTLPYGVTVYGVTYDGQYLQATETPAMNGGMGYVIKGDAGTYPMVKTTAEPVESELWGMDEDIPTSNFSILGTVCTLDVVGGQVGFYAFEGAILTAHKAFYLYTGVEEINGLAINFGGTEGIKTIAPAQKNTLSFDLQGRRVMNAQKGLFIQNGHKYIK